MRTGMPILPSISWIEEKLSGVCGGRAGGRFWVGLNEADCRLRVGFGEADCRPLVGLGEADC